MSKYSLLTVMIFVNTNVILFPSAEKTVFVVINHLSVAGTVYAFVGSPTSIFLLLPITLLANTILLTRKVRMVRMVLVRVGMRGVTVVFKRKCNNRI